ncbi:hypothetical protein UFOVP767_29 [uncultured Caudovirales phage]|jgi:hypothetical protein|uniref:Uncharacterized protein n=1 Tax=uncultured Caudovirales phage TaxID=2100421 RepID=A0A6J5NP29_9CAUD|nr:hypothetical protein UFOVP767_29 [uncultured Caudovirales phage]
MADRLPRYQQTGIAIDPYRAAALPAIEYAPLSREMRNLSQAQQGALDRVINFAGKIGMEQAEEKGRAAVDTPEKAKQVLEITKETGMPRTVYDKAAYDQANEIVALQLQNDGRRLLSEKVNAFKNDPNSDPIQFLAEAADVRDGLESLTTLLDPKLRGRVSNDLDRIKNVSFLEISERHNDRVSQQLKATTLAGLEQRGQDAIRIMSSGMVNSENMLFQELQTLKQFGISGGFSPLEIEREMQKIAEQAHIARFRKEYEKAPNKAEFLKRVQADLGAGPIGELYDKEGNPLKQNRITRGIDVNRMGALVNEIEADLRSRDAQFRALRTELKTDVSESLRIISLGQVPSEGVVTEIQGRARNLGLPANDPTMRQVNYLSILRQQSIAFNKMSPIQLGDWVRDAQSKTTGGATLEQAMLIDVAQKSLAHKTTMLEKDPVGYMNQTGAAEVKTLNFAASPVDLVKQIGERVTQSKSFAASMNVAPKYFSQDEAGALTTFLQTATPDQQITLLGVMNQGFGKNSGNAMNELSKFAPEFAHAGGLIISGASKQTVYDALNGMRQAQAGNKPFEGTGDAATRKNVIADQLGGAYAFAPKTRSAIISTADNIYTQRAIVAGKTTFDDNMYKQAFQEASGMTIAKNGKAYGGIIEYRGTRIPIPNNVAQDSFKDIINRATYEDFSAVSNGLPEDDQGRKFTIDRLRKGYPAFIDTDRAVWYYEDYRGKTSPLAFTIKDKSALVVDFRQLADRVKQREGIK